MKEKVTPEEFVRIWQGSYSAKEVCQKTGMSEVSVYLKARTFRSRGIPLKNMRLSRLSKDEALRLAELARSLENGDSQ